MLTNTFPSVTQSRKVDCVLNDKPLDDQAITIGWTQQSKPGPLFLIRQVQDRAPFVQSTEAQYPRRPTARCRYRQAFCPDRLLFGHDAATVETFELRNRSIGFGVLNSRSGGWVEEPVVSRKGRYPPKPMAQRPANEVVRSLNPVIHQKHEVALYGVGIIDSMVALLIWSAMTFTNRRRPLKPDPKLDIRWRYFKGLSNPFSILSYRTNQRG